MQTVKIHDFRYLVHMCVSGDSWQPFGAVYGHPNSSPGECVHVSTPISFNKEEKTFETVSGRKYEIVSFADGDEEKWMKELEDQIERRNKRK